MAAKSKYHSIVENLIKSNCLLNHLNLISDVQFYPSPKGRGSKISWGLISEENENVRGLVSLKTQDQGGTAEEKVVYEIVNLLTIMDNDSRYKKSWVCLVGPGFTPALKDFYIQDLHHKVPEMREKVFIINDLQGLKLTNFALP